MQKGLISVIIPTYNRGYCISDSISSVLNQSYYDIECIVVDNGSTDDTVSIVENIKDKRVKLICLTKNQGAASARNKGMEAAIGEYLAFNDSDDIWYPDKLEKQLAVFERKKETGLVYCDYLYEGDYVSFRQPLDIFEKSELEGDIFQSLLISNKIGTPTMLIKRKCIEAVGVFNENLQSLEDWEFALRIARKYKIGYVHEMLMRARYSEMGVNSNIDAKLEAILYIMQQYKTVTDTPTAQKKLFFNILALDHDKILVEKWKEKTVPNVFSTQEEFYCMYELASDAYHSQRISNILACFWDEKKIKKFICNCHLKPENELAIYGAGIVGVTLAQVLTKYGFTVACIIDRRQKNIEAFRMIQASELSENIMVIISTILSEEIDFIKGLWTRDIRVINIFDLLR